MTFKDWNSSIYENGIHYVANMRLGLEFCYLFSAENSDMLRQLKIIISSNHQYKSVENRVSSAGCTLMALNGDRYHCVPHFI
jgi:hypothetical protein